jgi:hypothetical protein
LKKQDLLSAIWIADKANETSLKGSGHFVGVVYDSFSPDGDFPIALVVGINYGQTATSKSIVGKNEDRVDYVKHVQKIAQSQNRPGEYHVVIWNFFPFLTELEWLEDIANRSDEATRIFERGYSDPIEVFSSLIEKLQPDLIVFHGISSAVPILARIALRRVGRQGVLVPNLSRPLVLERLQKIG